MNRFFFILSAFFLLSSCSDNSGPKESNTDSFKHLDSLRLKKPELAEILKQCENQAACVSNTILASSKLSIVIDRLENTKKAKFGFNMNELESYEAKAKNGPDLKILVWKKDVSEFEARSHSGKEVSLAMGSGLFFIYVPQTVDDQWKQNQFDPALTALIEIRTKMKEMLGK